MEAKLFEVLDRSTFIPVLAVRLEPDSRAERSLLLRSGFRPRDGATIMLGTVYGGHGPATASPDEWEGGRTLAHAHRHIAANWEVLGSGTVIDVEFVLGETKAPKASGE